MRRLAIASGLVVGWFAGGWCYLAIAGLMARSDLSLAPIGVLLSAAGAIAGGTTGYRTASEQSAGGGC